MSEKHLALLVEIPAAYTADIVEGGALREYAAEHDNESEFILSTIGEPGVVRVRMEISGEKDGDVVEVWGHVREASLVDPSRGYGPDPCLTAEQLADHGHKLMRCGGCEWCEYYESTA